MTALAATISAEPRHLVRLLFSRPSTGAPPIWSAGGMRAAHGV